MAISAQGCLSETESGRLHASLPPGTTTPYSFCFRKSADPFEHTDMTSLYKNWMTDSIESSPRERSPESFDFVLASLRINRRSFDRLICLAPLALALPAKKLYMYHDFFLLTY